ncbi:MAG TPA: nucleoside recognition domain-containing protein, partial [Candidatus Gracilibacteria bacterium]|nr:nucleoside recognition domain-containing protein [Candidatus Gracilibacteria bacterium]
MLNYVWIALIILGLAAAVSSDLSDDFSDKYKTGKHIPISLTKTESQPGKTSINGVITKKNYKSIFGESYPNDISFSIKGEIPASDKSSKITIILRDNIPPLLKTAAKNSGDENDLSAQLFIKDKNNLTGTIVLEKVSFTKMKEVTNSALSYADTAVTVALGLIGIMALWLGIMKIADASGIVNNIAKALKPLMRFLFPDIPPDHPAMGSIVMNLAASVLGLGNAATPFGIKAMEDMNTLNPNKGIATNAMCTFLVLNTSGFALMPSTAIALRAASGSSEPAIIIGTTMFGSFTGTVIGVLFVKLIENFTVSKSEILHKIISKYKLIATIIFGVIAIITLGKLGLLSSIASVFSFMSIDLLRSTIQSISTLAIPAMIFAFVAFGMIKKVKVYETFIEGAKEGFTIAVSIIPYLVAILMAIGI